MVLYQHLPLYITIDDIIGATQGALPPGPLAGERSRPPDHFAPRAQAAAQKLALEFVHCLYVVFKFRLAISYWHCLGTAWWGKDVKG